ncbi:MAG: SRPBCC family protein [Flavobacteriales bacterium]|jgi:uncharacterized protein YndB with AHSA1/START domain|tara:strand:- start:2732 stop:3271 length:540 start_codon:yes stop_codon:yes gene_type:complete
MRFVKFTLIGLIGITLAFFSLGFLHPSFSYQNQVEVDASVEESFKTFTNEALASEWLHGYVGKEILSGKELVVGSRFLMKFEQDGEEIEFIETLTEYTENEKFVFEMETDFFKGTVGIYFEGNAERTTIKVFTTSEGKNLFYRSMFYLLKSAFQQQAQVNYDLLKELIEKQEKFEIPEN